jgi:hypothetical protein
VGILPEKWYIGDWCLHYNAPAHSALCKNFCPETAHLMFPHASYSPYLVTGDVFIFARLGLLFKGKFSDHVITMKEKIRPASWSSKQKTSMQVIS